MNRMRRKLALIISLMLALGSLAGCNSTNSEQETVSEANVNVTGYPVVEDKITLTVMGATNSSLPEDWNDLVLFRELEKITNVHLDFKLIDSTNYDQQKNLAFASGNLPDMFYKGRISTQDEITYGGSGTLIDLTPYLEYAPNIMQAFEDFSELRASITLSDGKIVCLPEVNDVPRDRAEKMWINKTWLDKLGFEEPQTADELYEALKAFQTQDPNGNGEADEIAISFATMDSMYHMMSAFGLLYNVYAENDTVIYSPADERHREGLKYFNKLFEEGILDNQCFTQNSEKLNAKASGDFPVLGCFVSMSAGLMNPKFEEQYTLLPPLEGPNGERVWKGRQPFGKGAFAITSACKNPTAAIRVIDYLYGEEGGILARLGVENETYRILEDGTWEYIIPEDFDTTNKSFENTIGTVAGSYSPMRQPTDMILKAHRTREYSLDDQMEKLTPYLVIPYPSVYFTIEEQKKINSWNTDLSSAVETYNARAVIGEVDIDSTWDGYIQDLEKIGLREMIKLYQQKYDEYKAK